MGRYYSGNINGKFWFGVQSSDAADRFGVTGVQPQELYYYFDKEDLQAVEDEIALITKTIGEENLAKLDEFFETNNGYNDKILEAAGLLEIWRKHKMDYADLRLGKQIRDCIIDNGSCEFTAEC